MCIINNKIYSLLSGEFIPCYTVKWNRRVGIKQQKLSGQKSTRGGKGDDPKSDCQSGGNKERVS